jgi:Peptidase family C25
MSRRPHRLLAFTLALTLVTGVPLAAPAAAAPALSPSAGEAILFHLQFAEGIENGRPVGQSDHFPVGTRTIFGLLGWQYVPAGTELRVRLFQGDRFIYEDAHIVEDPQGPEDSTGAGFVFPFATESGFPAGDYYVEVDYNRVPDEIVPFTVGEGAGFSEVLGAGSKSGPIPYANPRDVLVVTREAALRQALGSRTDEVLAAARRVGDYHDLGSRSTAETATEEVHRLLRARPYKYLLIVGNDDVVPYWKVENPLADSEAPILADWELPSDWIPSDNYYTDLDGDPYGVPDLAVARIPSSDDADLLLTQLGENQPPDGAGYALINQERRSQAGVTAAAMGLVAQTRLRYVPPLEPQDFAADPDATNARYLYVLLHGIGVTTNEWSANTVAWGAYNQSDPLAGEWAIYEDEQAPGVTVETNPTNGGVVQIGACYGAWTLDTVQEPRHKTADNNLALHYLKNGTRAYIADTHISYSAALGPNDIARNRTGFELLLWQAIADGMTPIDAFQAAKTGMGASIDALVQANDIDNALVSLKTLHYMVYLGRP